MNIPINLLIRARRRTVALIVQPDGTLVVRAPLRLSREQIQVIVNEKAAWIQRKQAEIHKHQAQQPARRYVEGETFLFLGQAYPLRFISHGRARLALQDGAFVLRQDAQGEARAVFEAWYKAQARRIFTERVTHLAALHGLRPAEVKLSTARTRWGSCSPHRVIRLAWRLVMAPLPVVDYVASHELAHLVVPNHSAQFWARVKQIDPDFQPARAWLKANGRQLTLE